MLASHDPDPTRHVQPEPPPAATEALTVPGPAPLAAIGEAAEADGVARRAGNALVRSLDVTMPVIIVLASIGLPMLEEPAFTVAILLIVAAVVVFLLKMTATARETEEWLEAARLSREEAAGPAPRPASPYDALRGRWKSEESEPARTHLLLAAMPLVVISAAICAWLGVEYAALGIFLFVGSTCAVLWEANGGVVEAPTLFLVLPGPEGGETDLAGLGVREAAVRGFLERVGTLTFWDWERVLHWERWSAAKRKSRRRRQALERALEASRRAGLDPGAVAALVRARFSPVIGGDSVSDQWPSHAYAAAVGLLARGLIADEDLRALYAGFERVIPLRELDELPPAPKPLAPGAAPAA